MKYRRLEEAELNELKKEFIDFLVSNTVTADDWVFIKENEPLKAEQLIVLFSDMVLDRALEKIEYLELREPKSLMLFKCGKENMILIGVSVADGFDVDFTDDKQLEKLAEGNFEEGQFKVFKSTKKYAGTRELEVFNLTEQGCMITDDILFNLVKGLV